MYFNCACASSMGHYFNPHKENAKAQLIYVRSITKQSQSQSDSLSQSPKCPELQHTVIRYDRKWQETYLCTDKLFMDTAMLITCHNTA